MKEDQARKLHLHRETVKQLDPERLGSIAAGLPVLWSSDCDFGTIDSDFCSRAC